MPANCNGFISCSSFSDCETSDSLFAISGGHNCSSGISKESVRNTLVVCLVSPLFENSDSQRKVGSHSIRKAAATYARRCNMSKHNVEGRGRWKGDSKKKASTVYMNLFQPVPDALVASTLCGVAGPCKYVVHESFDNDDFLRQFIPRLYDHVDAGIARVLTAAVIWFASTAIHNDWSLPQEVRDRINALCMEGYPIVTRVLILVGGEGDQLIFYVDDSVVSEDGVVRESGSSVAPHAIPTMDQAHRIVELQFEVRSLKRRLEDLHTSMTDQLRTAMTNVGVQMKKMRVGIDRLGMMRRVDSHRDESGTVVRVVSEVHTPSFASLSKLPRVFYVFMG
jgi:hypothetical protein